MLVPKCIFPSVKNQSMIESVPRTERLMWPAMCGVLRVRVARLRKTKREITSTPKSER